MSTPAVITRFIQLSQRLFEASVRLVDTKQPLVTDLFCFINHFLATATGKALLQP